MSQGYLKRSKHVFSNKTTKKITLLNSKIHKIGSITILKTLIIPTIITVKIPIILFKPIIILPIRVLHHFLNQLQTQLQLILSLGRSHPHPHTNLLREMVYLEEQTSHPFILRPIIMKGNLITLTLLLMSLIRLSLYLAIVVFLQFLGFTQEVAEEAEWAEGVIKKEKSTVED